MSAEYERMQVKSEDHAPRRDTRDSPGRAVTMAEVGRLAGVSQVTVSRALSDPSKVSVKTLQKIRDAIEITGFVPNALAGALASSKSKLITALVPSITNIVYSTMVKSFAERMRDDGYQILLSETGFDPEEEERLISAHLSRRPDAVLLTGISHSARARKVLLGAGIPVVEVWDLTDSPVDLCVGFSHVEAARAVADFAVEAGYRMAGSVSAGDERARRRSNAFTKRFSAATNSDVPEVIFNANASLARGREGLARLLDQEGFEGGVVFCSSDVLAHGLLIEARSRGLSVPGDVAIIGFGDQDFAAFTEPGLTTVRVDRLTLGRAAAEAVLDRLSGAHVPSNVIDVGFEIIRRESA